MNEEQGTKKYQRKPRFLCPDDFEQIPLLRAFATGPSPAVKEREEPRAFFYCRMCRKDISTDKTFSRTPQSLALGHFKTDKHYLKDVKYRILKGLPAYHRDGTLMMQEEVTHKRRVFNTNHQSLWIVICTIWSDRTPTKIWLISALKDLNVRRFHKST